MRFLMLLAFAGFVFLTFRWAGGGGWFWMMLGFGIFIAVFGGLGCSGERYCSECEARAREEASYCAHCGAELD